MESDCTIAPPQSVMAVASGQRCRYEALSWAVLADVFSCC